MSAPANSDEELAHIILKACAHSPSERYPHPKDFRLELEVAAPNYANLQSKVFSDSGISYYANNSIFGTQSKGAMSVKSKSAVKTANEENAYTSEEAENTMLLAEPADESTVIVLDNFVAVNVEAVEEIAEAGDSKEKAAHCPICNNAIKLGNIFCGHCGHKLATENERSVICPDCGFAMKPGVKFCGKCGYRF